MDLRCRTAERGPGCVQVGRIQSGGFGGGSSEWHQLGTIRDDVGGVKSSSD